MNSKQKTVLITGATGKLGRLFVEGFLKSGWHVVVISRDISSAKDLMEKSIGPDVESVQYYEIDLEKDNSIPDLMQQLARAREKPDVLINNARNTRFLKTEASGFIKRGHWQGELLLDVIIPYELSVALAEVPGSELRSIINIASIYGVVSPNLELYDDPITESPINYGVAKAALIHLSKELAVRLAEKNINVNSISYGGVEGRVNEDFKKKYSRLCPSGRMSLIFLVQ